ncbi:MAG: response regulator [Chloroflexi bacterium]|nr:response regulator [Chloroflexota bacterium]
MDGTDRQIMEMLRLNGRRSNVEIARELGVSEGTVRKRVDRLLMSGALRIVGLVDPEQVGYTTRALIFVTVELPHAEEVGAALCQMPEVAGLYWITGEYDFVVDAVFASEKELRSFITERLSGIPGIVRTQAGHVLRIQKSAAEWALPKPPPPCILVVDDDPDFVEVTRMVLEREGYQVCRAGSGAEALQTMKAVHPDLVILDIMMDGVLDGWDASWRIRSNPDLRDTSILVVSAITASDYLGVFPTDQDNLVDNFLSKPVSPDRLLAEVDRLLARR